MIMTIVQTALLVPAQRGSGSPPLKCIWEDRLSTGHSFAGRKEPESMTFALTCAGLPHVDEACSSLASGRR